MVKFVDTAHVYISSGHGGPGCASFLREKFVEFGGPNGGDGGKGGDVLVQGDHSLTSLQDLRLHPHQRAKNGEPGMGKQKSGKAGEDCLIKLPLGTILVNAETDEVVFEVVDESLQLV